VNLTLFILAALGIVCIGPTPALASETSCAGFPDRSYPVDVNRFYADRAIAVIKAGLGGDQAKLGALVYPTARFLIWRGDFGVGRQLGIAGAIEMARNMAPTRFESITIRPGPISISSSKCEWSTTVLFRTQQAETAFNVAFKFVDGLLVEAYGHEVDRYESNVRFPPFPSHHGSPNRHRKPTVAPCLTRGLASFRRCQTRRIRPEVTPTYVPPR
jgi:hypothetical protein